MMDSQWVSRSFTWDGTECIYLLLLARAHTRTAAVAQHLASCLTLPRQHFRERAAFLIFANSELDYDGRKLYAHL